MERQLEWHWGPRHDRRAAKKRPLLTDRHKVEIRTRRPERRPARLDDGSSRSCSPTAALRPLTDLPARGIAVPGTAPPPGAAARIETLGEDSLRLMLSEVCNFDEIRLNHKGLDTHRVVGPPREILQSILVMDGLDQRRFPPLEMLASAPLLGSDGRIISRPGYHRRDQIYL